jgi:hypothetical protein
MELAQTIGQGGNGNAGGSGGGGFGGGGGYGRRGGGGGGGGTDDGIAQKGEAFLALLEELDITPQSYSTYLQALIMDVSGGNRPAAAEILYVVVMIVKVK